jgi:hypothetical protein
MAWLPKTLEGDDIFCSFSHICCNGKRTIEQLNHTTLPAVIANEQKR